MLRPPLGFIWSEPPLEDMKLGVAKRLLRFLSRHHILWILDSCDSGPKENDFNANIVHDACHSTVELQRLWYVIEFVSRDSIVSADDVSTGSSEDVTNFQISTRINRWSRMRLILCFRVSNFGNKERFTYNFASQIQCNWDLPWIEKWCPFETLPSKATRGCCKGRHLSKLC